MDIPLKSTQLLLNSLMTNLEDELKEALMLMQEAISKSDAPAITRSLKILDEIKETKSYELHPQLAHYLKRRSYEKALMFLKGEDGIPKGRCS